MGHRRTRRIRRTKNRRYRKQKGGDILPSFNENKNEENKDSGIFGKVSKWFEDPNWIPESSTPSTSSQNAGRRRRRRKNRRTYKK
jgi:hypothetical protein